MQFEEDLEQLIYCYHEEDENITSLKKAWGKKGTFIKDIPDDLHEQLIPKKSVAVLIQVVTLLQMPFLVSLFPTWSWGSCR